MPGLELTLLGMPGLSVNGRINTELVSRKAQALLIYLAMTGQKHARQTLAGLLWGEMSESNARRNLRVTLTKLKADLGEYLLVRRLTLAINPDASIWVDVNEFESCLAPDEPTLQQLQRAADLYKGHFLDGFYLREAPLFEDWVRPLQERYRQMAMETLYRLAVYYTQQKQYGPAMNYAGRLLTLEPWMEEAHRQMMLLQTLSGQRSAALAQYETCRAMLEEELGVEPAEATTKLYEQILNEEIGEDLTQTAVSFPKSTAPAPFQAPARSPHFVGRLTLLTELSAALTAADSQQIQALAGMGGIGKSTVAVEIAHIARKSFTDGVLWAQAATAEPIAILESWAQAYGYDFSRIGDVESMAAAFRGVLAEKSVLIVLDDVDSIARIRPLLPNGDRNQVLITTRSQDIARSLNAQVWPLLELSPENGRLLLTSILGEARTGAEPEAAAEICQLLENHPLAVEIIAQRLKSRPRRRLADIVQRLHDERQRLSLLAISDREVRASFAVSWQALDVSHRRVFALLGLFNGRSFSAEAIAHIAELDQYTAEDRLFALAALSLIREEAQTRYRQHPLLADFAREQLGEDVGEENGRFVAYYLHFAQQHQQNYNALRPEWDNMMAAMETAFDNKFSQLLYDFADTLKEPWFTRGRFHQAQQGLQWAYHQARERSESNQIAQYALLLGETNLELSRYAEATGYFEESLQISSHIQDRALVAATKYHLARLILEQKQTPDRYQKAETLLLESQRIRAETEDSPGMAAVLYQRARICYAQKNYQLCDQLGDQALTLQKECHDIKGQIPTLRLLALSASHQENDVSSEQFAQSAYTLSNEVQDQGEVAASLYTLAAIYVRQKNFEAAKLNAESALDYAEKLGLRRMLGQLHYQMSLIYEQLEDFSQAIAFAESSSHIFEALQHETGHAYSLVQMGDLYQESGNPTKAETAWRQALTIADHLENQSIRGDIVERLGIEK